MNRITRTVFISSTIRDLHNERRAVREFVESRLCEVDIRVLMSEDPDFPVSLESLADKNAYVISLEGVKQSDIMVLLIESRYGVPLNQLDNISITHAEYREAYNHRIPVFAFVHEDAWEFCESLSKRRKGATSIDPRICELIDEIGGSKRKKWMFAWKSVDDILSTLESNLFDFDDSIFVDDVTISDGTPVRERDRFEKIWAIRNAGMVTWRNRFLEAQDRSLTGLKPDLKRVAIKTTVPGEVAEIGVWFTAPKYPGRYRSTWKMVDEKGKFCLPWKKGIWVEVRVVDR